MLGTDARNMSKAEVTSLLKTEIYDNIKYAEKFIQQVEDPFWKTKATILKAVAKGVIKHYNNQYFHNEVFLGSTLDEVSAFFESNLAKNKKIQNLIFSETENS
jgi:hypothetical protein